MDKKTTTLVRTQWFDASVKPVRPGLYERQYRSAYQTSIPDMWDGEKWMLRHTQGEILRPAWDPLPWRGIARGRGRPAKSA